MKFKPRSPKGGIKKALKKIKLSYNNSRSNVVALYINHIY